MENNTLNVSSISEGFVLDHIQAGKSMDIYHYLRLDKLDCCVAIIKNARSNKMGKKDIMKIECPIDIIDLDILGFIDHNITINIILFSVLLFTIAIIIQIPTGNHTVLSPRSSDYTRLPPHIPFLCKMPVSPHRNVQKCITSLRPSFLQLPRTL